MRSMHSNKRRVLARTLGIAAFCVLAPPAIAHAHFRLMYPPQWITDNTSGDPQKAAPCGVYLPMPSMTPYTATNVVTAFAPGQKITLQWSEVVPHDGWYRIALSYNNRADLVDPPYQIASGNSVDAGIESPPVAPVLVDGLFPHTAASLIGITKSYSYDLTLPTTPCTKCTLQVIQIMLNHPNNTPYGYTYHHCADISIQGAADGGTIVSDAGPNDATTSGSSGGSGSSGSGSSSGAGGSSGTGGSSGVAGSSGVGGSSGSGGSSGASGSSGAASNGSGGSSGAGDGGGFGNPATPSSGSCGCAVVGDHAPAAWGVGGLAALAAFWRRRRRASSKHGASTGS